MPDIAVEREDKSLELVFVIKYMCTLLRTITYQSVYVSLTEQKILNISPNLISILKRNWKKVA